MIKKSKKTSEARSDDYPELTQKDIDRAVRRKGLKIVLKLDAQGRLTLPLKMREDYNLKPGDCFLVSADKTGIHLARTENPFDILAEHALNQHEHGNCVEIREFARKNGIKVSK